MSRISTLLIPNYLKATKTFNGSNIEKVFDDSKLLMNNEVLKINKETEIINEDICLNFDNLSLNENKENIDNKDKNDKKEKKEKKEKKQKKSEKDKSIYSELNINPLQPNKYELLSLKNNKELVKFISESTRLDWILNIDLDMLFQRSNSKESFDKIKFKDQYLRAKNLVDMIEDHDEIVLMDGHGRFIVLLIILLYRKKPEIAEKIRIIVVDNFLDKEKNPVVTEWHKLFFPKSITCVQDNIYNYKPSNSRLVYLNFCGIGGDKGITSFLNYLNKCEKGNNLLLSFSVLRAAKNTLKKIIDKSKGKIEINENSDIYFKETTNSKKFRTFKIFIN